MTTTALLAATVAAGKYYLGYEGFGFGRVITNYSSNNTNESNI
jgi:hypothetical protein